jgi:hypothetical protein
VCPIRAAKPPENMINDMSNFVNRKQMDIVEGKRHGG